MRNAFRRTIGRQAGLCAGLALLAMPTLATADEMWVYAGASVIPGKPLVSFDISWVDRTINEYFLSDRSNSSIDVMPIEANPPVFQIIPVGVEAFAGFTGNNNTSGPNGNLTLNDPLNNEGLQLWVGDGPTPNPVCAASNPNCSTVKIFNDTSGRQPAHVINTNGVMRADELCFVPAAPGFFDNNGGIGYVVIANDSDTPPYLNFIPTSGPQAFRVTRVVTVPEATNGIEQCKWDPLNNRVLVNIPEVNGNGTDDVAGEIISFDAGSQALLFKTPYDFNTCAGPQGMAIGSRDFDQNGDPIKNVPPATFPGSDQILIGCSAKGGNGRFDLVIVHQPTIIDATVPVAVDLPNVGGADEVWFDGLAAQHYASASSSNPIGNLMPIIDANVGDGAIDTIITVGFSSNSGRKAHSVAGWSGNAPVAGNLTAFFVPIPAAGGGTAPFSSAACTTAAALGCIAYYTTSPIPTGTDSP